MTALTTLITHLALAAAPALTLAWRPFLDPIDLHDHWLWLLPPLAFAIALVYKTLKLPDLDHLWSQAFRLTGMILLIAASAAALLWLLVELA